MTDRERIERLEDRLLELRYRVDALDKSVLVEVEPQRPKPGTVVEWRSCVDHHWSLGIVGYDGWVVTLQGEYRLDDPSIDYRPVEILREGEYKIKPPPLEDWPSDAVAWILTEHESFFWNFDYVFSIEHRYGLGRHIATVTREDMERREAGE